MEIDLELYREEVLVSETPPVRLSYIEVTPEDPIGTMVFVHGFGGYAMQWKNQLKAFSDEWRVITYDLRGHSRSSAPHTRYDMDEMQADLDGLLSALDVKFPVVLVGHSFGGAIVTAFAHRRPHDVSHLVLVAATGEYKLFAAGDWALRLPLTVLRPVSRLARRQLAAEAHVLKHLYQNGLSPYRGWDMLRTLPMPTLVIRGDRDQVYPAAEFEKVAQTIPDADDVNIGASSHLVPLERAEAVNRAITRFLVQPGERVSGGARTQRSRQQMAQDRPWLRHYEQSVPHTLGYPNRGLQRVLHSTALRFGRRPALTFAGGTMSYRRLDDEANRLANALRSLGVDKGVRVLLLLPNTPQFVIAYYAVLKAGGIVVSTSSANDQAELERELQDSGAEVLITLTLFAETARAATALRPVRALIYASIKDYMGPGTQAAFTLRRETPEGHRPPETLARNEYLWRPLLRQYPPTLPTVRIQPGDTAVIQYTGGTTDVPKGVILTHRALLANALQTRHWIPDLREGHEVMLCVLPFSHSYGMTAAMNLSILLGARMVLLPSFATEEVLKTIQQHKPTLFPGVPTMYMAINQFKGVRRYGIQSIRACISGAAPLPVEVAEAFEKLTKGRVVEGYGLTEAGPVTHSNPLHGLRKVGSIGVPLPGTEARIVDLVTREPLPPGQLGELAVRGPQLMTGYWNRPDDTSEAFTGDGWLLTGDIARMDDDYFFQIISRKKEMILAGQYQVYPRDVEEVLYEHPGVKEVAVVGLMTADEHSQKVKAYVVPRPGSTLNSDDLIRFCQRRLEEYAVPWEIEFREELPKSFVGKVLRRLLVEETPAAPSAGDDGA